MNDIPSKRLPRRTWALAALIIALAAILGLVALLRPRAPAPAPATVAPAEVKRMELPSYTVLRTPEPITVDGVLDEPVWRRLQPVGGFVIADGSAAQFETEAKLCWDDEYLYLAFSCVDNDIWGTYTRRDDTLYEQEVVEVFLDPSGYLVAYYEFEVSPRNVIWDGKIYSPGRARDERWRGDPQWNCEGLLTGVRVVGTVDDRSDLDQVWTVEMAIPFAGMEQPPPREGERWRANLFRIDRGEQDEFSSWSATLTDQPNFHVPLRFGHLVFSMREA